MDSLQGIPVEYKLDTFNMPRTGTTLCHPKIDYVDQTCNPALDTLALNSPLGHLNGDSANSPHQIPDMKLHVDSKAQSLTRPTTHTAISTFSTSHYSISSQYTPRVLQHQKQTQYSMLQNKNLIPKIPFDYRHHTSSSSSIYFSQHTEGTNNSQRGNNTT